MTVTARSGRGSRLVSIAGSVVGTQVVNAVLGVIFWTTAARMMPAAEVGQLGSASAAVMLLGLFGIVGCGTLLIGRLGQANAYETRRLLTTATIASTVGAGLLALAFGIGTSLLVPSFAYLTPAGAAFWWLVIAAALTSAGSVFDQAMLVIGNPAVQVARNGLAGLLKISVLAGACLLGQQSVAAGLGAWAVGQLAADGLAFVAAWRLRPATQPLTLAVVRATAAAHWREALHHHGLNVALAAPSLLLPVIIAGVISVEANAVFTTVRLISMFAFVVPYALAIALFASLAADPSGFAERARSVFRLSLFVSLLLTGTLWVAAPLALAAFGNGYADQGVPLLRLIAFAGPLLVFKDQCIARAQARGTLRRVMPYVAVTTVAEVLGTLVGAGSDGLRGALCGWLVALALGAAWVVVNRPDRWRNMSGQVANIPEQTRTQSKASGGDVSVVVCTYDIERLDQLLACLDSLRAQTMRPREVIVVVDGTDEVAEALHLRAGPETLHVLPVNSGLSAARNAGVDLVVTRWVAFLDDDAVAEPSWLQRMVDAAEDLSAAGASGRSLPAFDGPEPDWFPPEMLWTVGCSYLGLPTERSLARNVFGGCAVLRTDLFRRVGGYDVTLGRRGSGVEGGEEADFSLRVAKLDATTRFVLVPEAVIRHRVGVSRLSSSYVFGRCYSDGRTKSILARRLGTGALSTEKAYLARIVPLGVLRAMIRGRWRSAYVLIGGMASAACGYVAGRMAKLPHPVSEPVKVSVRSSS
jgi:O-antigen/teichoic acid export membrane protein/glycosyltransferase involved in cell wall biosynthesis